MSESNEVAVAEQPTQQSYDAGEILNKVGEVHTKVMAGIMKLDTERLVNDAKQLDAVASMMSGIAGTAVQIIKAGREENSTNVGLIADAVMDKMKASGMTLINVNDGAVHEGQARVVNKNLNVNISLDDGQVIEPAMLARGLVARSYSDFAKDNDMYDPDSEG